MSFEVKVQPSGRSFIVDEDEYILDAALRHGLNFPYGCRSGYCGSCKGKVVNGAPLDYPDGRPVRLSDADVTEGYALFCQARARSDLVIEVHEIGSADEISVKKLPCRVERMEPLAPDVMRLYLKIPDSERLQFLAGQYLDILLRDGRRRSFSIANAPHDDALIELHVRHVDGGDFTGHIFQTMKPKDILRIEAPLGNFYWREGLLRPMIFMAGGTGFAPIKSIIQHALAEEVKQPMYLYWGVRARQDLYLPELLQEWADTAPQLRIVPVLSQARAEDRWTGRTGYVHDAIMADFGDLSDYVIYASGPPPMVSAGWAAFSQRGLPNEFYFSDAFEFQTPKPAG